MCAPVVCIEKVGFICCRPFLTFTCILLYLVECTVTWAVGSQSIILPSHREIPDKSLGWELCVAWRSRERKLLNGKLRTRHTSGLPGAQKACEHWEISEEAAGKDKEEQRSDQYQIVFDVQVSVNCYHSPCFCVGMLVFADKWETMLSTFIHKAKIGHDGAWL